MERATSAGKHSVMLTSRKVKTIVAVGVVAISAIALFGRCKPASEDINKAKVQTSAMAEPAQKRPIKEEVKELPVSPPAKVEPAPHTSAEVLKSKPVAVDRKHEAKHKRKIFVGHDIEDNSAPYTTLVDRGSGRH